jgi:hypothetical protein
MQIFWVRSADEGDFWGPYTTKALAALAQDIISKAGILGTEIAVEDCDEHIDKIEAGLKPYHIHVAVIGGEPQLPATVRLTWPPAEREGIQDSTVDETNFFVWAMNEKDALLRLARLNKATPRAKAEAEA